MIFFADIFFIFTFYSSAIFTLLIFQFSRFSFTFHLLHSFFIISPHISLQIDFLRHWPLIIFFIFISFLHAIATLFSFLFRISRHQLTDDVFDAALILLPPMPFSFAAPSADRLRLDAAAPADAAPRRVPTLIRPIAFRRRSPPFFIAVSGSLMFFHFLMLYFSTPFAAPLELRALPSSAPADDVAFVITRYFIFLRLFLRHRD